MAERETVQPDGRAHRWTETEIARLARITPAVLADAKADARRVPALNACLRAQERDRG